MLVAARVIMGVGAAASEPGTLSIIRHLYPERARRARAVGAWAAVAGLALAMGPVIGGVLVGLGSWRTVFWFNLAAGLLVLLAALVTVPESVDPQSGRMDIAGFVLGPVALGAAIFAVIHGETTGYRDPVVAHPLRGERRGGRGVRGGRAAQPRRPSSTRRTCCARRSPAR